MVNNSTVTDAGGADQTGNTSVLPNDTTVTQDLRSSTKFLRNTIHSSAIFNQSVWSQRGELAKVSPEQRKIYDDLRQQMASRRSLYGQRIKHTKRAFQSLDSDSDGLLDAKEFEQGLKVLGLTLSAAQVEMLMNAIGTDGTKRLPLCDFVAQLHSRAIKSNPVSKQGPKQGSKQGGGGHKTINANSSNNAQDDSMERMSSKEKEDISVKDGGGLSMVAAASAPAATEETEEKSFAMAGVVRRMEFARAPGQIPITASEVREDLAEKVFVQLRDAVRQNRSLYGKVVHDSKLLFAIMDKDGDGKLSLAEFSSALRRLGLGLQNQQVDEVLTTVGKTPGCMTYSEFLGRLATVSSPRHKAASVSSRISRRSRKAALKTHSSPVGRSELVRARWMSGIRNVLSVAQEDSEEQVSSPPPPSSPSEPDLLPVMRAIIWRLDALGAVPCPVIFGAPGSFSELEVMHQQLMAQADPETLLQSSDDVNTIGALLVRWVRETCGPLVPQRLHSQCADAMAADVEAASVAGVPPKAKHAALAAFVNSLTAEVVEPSRVLALYLKRTKGGTAEKKAMARLFAPAFISPAGPLGGDEQVVRFAERFIGILDCGAEKVIPSNVVEDEATAAPESGEQWTESRTIQHHVNRAHEKFKSMGGDDETTALGADMLREMLIWLFRGSEDVTKSDGDVADGSAADSLNAMAHSPGAALKLELAVEEALLDRLRSPTNFGPDEHPAELLFFGEFASIFSQVCRDTGHLLPPSRPAAVETAADTTPATSAAEAAGSPTGKDGQVAAAADSGRSGQVLQSTASALVADEVAELAALAPSLSSPISGGGVAATDSDAVGPAFTRIDLRVMAVEVPGGDFGQLLEPFIDVYVVNGLGNLVGERQPTPAGTADAGQLWWRHSLSLSCGLEQIDSGMKRRLDWLIPMTLLSSPHPHSPPSGRASLSDAVPDYALVSSVCVQILQ